MLDRTERLAAVDDRAEERFFRALRPGLRREYSHHGPLQCLAALGETRFGGLQRFHRVGPPTLVSRQLLARLFEGPARLLRRRSTVRSPYLDEMTRAEYFGELPLGVLHGDAGNLSRHAGSASDSDLDGS